MRIKKSASPSHSICPQIFCSLSLGGFDAVLYRNVIVMVDKVNTYINKMFSGGWEISFSFYYFVLLDSALARHEVFIC